MTTCADACTAKLTGATVLATVLGPAVGVSRNSDSPARFNLTMKPFMADFTFENADWDAWAPPAVNVTETTPPPAPNGFINYPPDTPRGWQIETMGLRYSQLSIKAYGLPNSMSDGDKSQIKLFKYHNGVPTDITTGFEGNAIKGVTYDTSLFTLIAPLSMFDKQGPVTNLSLPQGAPYVSTSTALRLSAVDLSSNSYAVAGVAATYYLIDLAPAPGCFSVQQDTSAPQGTCANSVYSAPFTLGEGSYTVYAQSVDKLGNYGGSISSGVYVDGTPPETFISTGSTWLAAGATAYITAVDSITITAEDPVSNGVASGPGAIYMLIDITPEECDYAEGLGGINVLGSCENPLYNGPFTLPEGEHAIYYGAVDKTGNRGAVKSVNITVIPMPQNLDTVPPAITASINGQVIADSVTVNITSTDTITLNAEDAGSGVLGRYYTIDIEFSTAAATIYTAPFMVAPGTHTMYYSAMDNAGNMAVIKGASLAVPLPGDMMPSGYIRKIAGTGDYGYSGDGGDALNAKFGGPAGIVFDKSGNLLIADSGFNVVRKITPEGKVFTIAGTGVSGFGGDGGPAASARLSGPNDLAVDSLGNIYIADRWNNRVRKITAATGNISTIVENLVYPKTLGIDKTDNLYIYDYSGKVYKILPGGLKLAVAGTGVSGYSGDNGLAAAAQISAADGLAFDADNNLYIADTYNRRIRKVDVNGIITTVAGGGTLTADDVPALQKNFGSASASDVELDGEGNLFVVNGYTLYRIAKATGLVGTVGGGGYLNVNSTPMPAAFASISYSPRFSLDGAGGIYLLGNGVINKVALPGVVGSADGLTKLYSSGKGIAVSALPADSPAAAAFFAAAGRKGLLPAGAVYSVSPAGAALFPPGSVTFKYNPQVVVDTNTLAVFTYDGVSLSSSPDISGLRGQRTLPAIPYYNAGNLIAAEVRRIPGLAGLLIQVLDKIPPRSELVVGTPAFGAAPVFVSSGTPFTLTSSDDLYLTGDMQGLGVSYNFVRIKKSGVLLREISSINPAPAPGRVFVSTFSLNGENTGVYTIEYYSADVSGNAGSVKAMSVTLDTEAPSTELALEGPVEPAGGGFNSLSGFNTRIVSTDPVSGVANIKYLVNITTGACNWTLPVVSTAQAGTCLNPIYSGPFALSAGTHTVYYSAVDNVGNQTPVKGLTVYVKRSNYPDAAQWPYFEYLGGFGAYGTGPGYFKNLRGLSFDQSGNLWTADGANSKIEIFTPGGEYLRTFNTGLTAVGDFSICPDGTFWALAQMTGGYTTGLKKFSGDGALVREVDISGSQQFGYAYPGFTVCDRENSLFLAVNETAGAHILNFDSGGNYKGKFPINIPNGGYGGLASDADGNILVLDYSANPNFKIKKFSRAGALLASMPLISSSAYSMSVDSYGNIYIPNSSYSSVEIYSSTGGLLGTFGDLPSGRQMAPIGQPRYLGVHPYSGRLYVGGASEIKIYGPDHTPPQYVPGIISPGVGAVIYTTTPFISGSADAVAQIAAYEGAALVGKTKADRYGDFLFNQTGLGMGRHLLRFQSSDAAGNLSLISPQLDITIKNMNSVEFSTPVWGPGSLEVGYSIVDTSATALGDFDRDGNIDVMGFSRNARYSFYKGNGDGTFKYIYTAQIPGMANQYSGGDDALSGDFNNDGFLDVAASVYSPNYPYSGSTLVLIYGNGDGTFQTPAAIDHLLGYAGIAKGDFNKDGYLDLASASGNSIKVYLGDPASLFISISTSIPAELPPSSGGGITMSDIDGDGKADIVFRNAVLFGDGFNGFDGKVILPYSYTYTADVRKALASDFNQDGRKDIFLIAVDEALSFLNLGNRTFKKVQRTQTGGVYFYSGASADFNGDGITDIAVSPYQLQNVYVLSGHGDGTFAAPRALPTGGYSQYGHLSGTLLAEDVNGDGRNDIFQASSELRLAGGQEINTFFSFLNRTAAPDLIPPAAVSISAENTEAGEVAVSWLAPGNDGNSGRAVRYDLRYKTTQISSDIDFNAAQSVSGIAAPRTSGSTERFTLSTLAGGTSYYFALKTYDGAENVSALSNSPGVFTKYIVIATETINGNPEISMVSAIQPYITRISTVSGPGAVAIGSAAVQSLTMASRMYEIKPEGVYEPPAALTFYYSPAALAGIGLAEADAAVYEYFSGTGWEKLPGQVLDTLNHRITVPITRIASLFGIFGVVKDRTAPLSEFLVAGSSWTMSGAGSYINARSSVAFSAFDPVVYGTSTGVAFTEFRIDADTTAPFLLYTEAFTLSPGAHKVEFRSRDKAGNIEAGKTADIFVDGEAPSTWYTVAGSSFAAGNVLYAAAGSTITIVSSDTASGIKELVYVVNGSTYSASSWMAEIYLSSGGANAIAYHAEDNVGNIGDENSVFVYVDTTAPASTLSITGSLGRGGWYLSAVDAKIGALDDSSGIRDVLFSLDGSRFAGYISSFSVLAEGTHTIKTYSLDNVLNSEIVHSSTFGIDISTPLVGYSYLPAANAGSWNNTPVDVVFVGTDAISGIEYCSSSFTITGEGIGIPVSGYCADYAGWTSTISFSVNIDTTAPSSNAEIAAEHGLNGWLLSSAGVTLISTDSLSGSAVLYYSVDGSSFALYSSSFAVSGEGAHLLKYYSIDRAGNKEIEKELAFKLDLSAPLVGAVSGPVANIYGWNNTAVSVVFSGTDTVSGLAYCEPGKTASVAGSSQTVTGYCTDYAGLSSTATYIVSIDTVAPLLAYSRTQANIAGWNNSDVTIGFECSDDLSGMASCPGGITYSEEGINISTSVRVWDLAGNYQNLLVSGIYIDKTQPVSTAIVSGTYRNGWYSSAVEIVIRSTDTLSGIKETYYSLDGSTYTAYQQTLSIVGEGPHEVRYYAVDKAGNIETGRKIGFKIDSRAPAIDYILNPAANPAGWNNSAVSAVFTGTDAVSGVEECYSGNISVEGARQEIAGWCRDFAGNIGYSTAAVNIDLTSPDITISSPAAGRIFVATRGKIDFGYDVKDNLDPAPVFGAFLVQTEDRGSPRGNRPAVIAVINGQTIEPLDIDDGIWRLTASATDFADNISSAAGGLFEVVHDVLPPRTALSSGGYKGAGPGLYVTGRTTFTITSIDDLTAVMDGIGLGVKKQNIRLNGPAARDLYFANAAPLQGAAFSSTFRLDREADGVYGLAWNSEDVLGNSEKINISAFIVDNTTPQTAFNRVSGPAYLAYISTWTLFELAPADPGAFASGVKETVYSLNDGVASTGPLKFTLPEADGNYLVKYRSEDNLDNLEVEKSSQVFVDAAPPSSALNIIGGKQYPGAEPGSFYASQDSKFGFAAADPVINNVASGLENIYYGIDAAPAVKYMAAFSLVEGVRIVNYSAKDNVGNTEVVKSTVIYVDGTKPATALSLSGDQYNGDKQYISQRTDIIITALDPAVNNVAVGVKDTKYSVDGGLFVNYSLFKLSAEGKRLVSYYSMDFVANIEIVKTAALWVDNTPPATELSIAGARHSAVGDEKLYITRDSGIVLTSSDPITNDTASGVMLTKYRIDSGNWQVYSGSFTIADEGLHTLEYYALDRVQNAEALKTVKIAVDNTPPASRLMPGQPKYELDGYTLVSAATLLTLEAADPLSGGAASGVSGIHYSIDASPEVPYFIPFALTSRGLNTVRWWSVDNVQNTEPAHTAVYELDNEAPVLTLDCPGESFKEICNIYNSTFTVYGTVSDKYIKSWRLEYAPGADAQGGYLLVSSGSVNITTDAIGLLDPSGLNGAYTLRLSAADLVENAVVKQVNIRIGKPSVQLSLGGRGGMFKEPESAVVDGRGRIYVADTGNDRVAVYTSTGGFVRYYGAEEHADKEKDDIPGALDLDKPAGLAVDKEGAVYIADAGNKRVVKLSSDREILLVIGGEENRGHKISDREKDENGEKKGLFRRPHGLALDAAGNIYVTDAKAGSVQKLSPNGEPLMRIALPPVGERDKDEEEDKEEDENDQLLAEPAGIAVDEAGSIYVADTKSGRVFKYGPAGELLSVITDKAFKKPYGIAASPDGECIIVTDAGTGLINKLDRKGRITLRFGREHPEDGEKRKDGISEPDDERHSSKTGKSGKEAEEDRNDPLSPVFKKPGLAAFGPGGELYTSDMETGRIVKLGMPVAAPIVLPAGPAKGTFGKSAFARVSANVSALTGPDPEFRLGEVYVFPNPAKGADAPTFHIETGIADSVKITIYTISGRLAREQTLAGLPAEIDDGNGLSYAYEYTWRSHIPSGVYLYYIEAQKAGQKLKKTGKFSVVR